MNVHSDFITDFVRQIQHTGARPISVGGERSGATLAGEISPFSYHR